MKAKTCLPSFRLFLVSAAALLLLQTAGCGSRRSCDIRTAPGAGCGATIAAVAKTQVGTPYRYGGTSPSKGFDCSGLVYWACAKNGISVPRVSGDQARMGKRIKRKDLRPGDILIFKIPRSGYHTGIYLGKDRFIHSPRPRTRVRVESLSVDYWKRCFVSGRRVARP